MLDSRFEMPTGLNIKVDVRQVHNHQVPTMEDIFQFYSSSADVAPGKGTGESLSSPADTYAELRKEKGWRRILAEAHITRKEPTDTKLLTLTQSAQLWYTPPRKPKERSTILEEMRSKALRTTVQEAEMEAPKAKKTRATKNKVKKGGDTPITSIPEGALAGTTPPEEPSTTPPDLEIAEKTSAIRFCPVCNYYLYLQVSGEEQTLSRLCRCCGYHEQDEKGGMVMEMMVQERSDEAFKILLNEFTRKDPRLPHLRGTIKCPDATCDSNHGKASSDIIYIKYDAVNMLYLYICDICGFMWRSSR